MNLRFVEDEPRGVRLVEIEHLLATDPADLFAEDGGCISDERLIKNVESAREAVGGEGRSIRTEGPSLPVAALVSGEGVDRRADLEGEGNRSQKIAPEIEAEVALLGVPIGLVGRRVSQGVVASVVHIDGGAGARRAITRGNRAARVRNIVTTEHDARERGRREVEKSRVDVVAVGSGTGQGSIDLPTPEFAAVAVFQRGVFRLGGDVDVLAAAVHGHRADAGGCALCKRRATGRARAIAETEHTARDIETVVAVVHVRRDRVSGADTPINADGALQRLERLREAVPLARRLHEPHEVPRRLLVGVFGARLHGLETPGARAANRDGEIAIDRLKVTEIEGRLDELRRVVGVVVARAAVEGETIAIVKLGVNVVAEFPRLGLEAAARNQIDRAAES